MVALVGQKITIANSKSFYKVKASDTKKSATALLSDDTIIIQRNPAIAHFKAPVDFMPYCESLGFIANI